MSTSTTTKQDHVLAENEYAPGRSALYMFSAGDDRLSSAKVKILGRGTYDRKAGQLTVGEDTYTVFEDWSVRKLDCEMLIEWDGGYDTAPDPAAAEALINAKLAEWAAAGEPGSRDDFTVTPNREAGQ